MEGLSILILAHDNTCAGNSACTCEPTRKLIKMGENYVTKMRRDEDDGYALMELASWGRGLYERNKNRLLV